MICRKDMLLNFIFILYQYLNSSEELAFFLGEGNDLLSAEAENINKPFILASTGERNNISTSGSDGGFLAKTKEGTAYDKYFLVYKFNEETLTIILLRLNHICTSFQVMATLAR